MTHSVSPTRAHVLVQEHLAALAPGERLTGVAENNPAIAFPRGLTISIAKPNRPEYGGGSIATKVRFDQDVVDEQDIREAVQRSVQAIRLKEESQDANGDQSPGEIEITLDDAGVPE